MKTKKSFGVYLTLCVVFILLSVGMMTAFAADDLTVTIDTGASVTLKDTDSNGYYEISTADELYAFAATVNGGNGSINGELTGDIVVNENVLNENGEMNGDGLNFRVWTPIGNIRNKFSGNFDGNEYKVLGLYFNNNSVKYVGLFGFMNESGKVQNTEVKDFYFNGGEFCIAGVAGVNSGTVINCRSAGAVIGDRYIGGVVGDNNGTVINCHNSSTVKGCYFVGGIAGNSNGTVENCYNINTVWCYQYGGYVGGVVGDSDSIIANCYNAGEVKGAPYVGGVVGINRGVITNCYYLTECSEKGIGLEASSSESVVSAVTEAQVKATSGEEGSLIDMLNRWVSEQNDVKYKGWHFCSDVFADYPTLNLEYTYLENGANHYSKCTLCGYEATEEHNYIYTVNNDGIRESCRLCTHSASIKLVLPETYVYNGNAHKASYTGSFANPDVNILIQYMRYNEEAETGYEILDSAPVDAGTYVVRLSIGETYIDKSITIATKDIALMGVEVSGKEYDGTPYVEVETTYGYGGFKADGISDYDNIEIICTSAELESANAGTYEKVTVKGLTVTGENAHNYTIIPEATIPVYNIWGNYESSVSIDQKYVLINIQDQETGSIDRIDQSKWAIDEYYRLLEGHRIDSLKLVAEMNEGSAKYGSISMEEGSVRITDADGNDVTENYSLSAFSATLIITCPDHDEFEHGFCKNCGGYEKANYNENEGYYEIERAGQLFWFAEYVANISNEANAKLTDNITIPKDKEWIPIYNLYGTFDGNYKTISGLNVSGSDSDYIGFIGYVGYWADVRNLHITDSNFIGADASYAGAIVGYHGGGEITNCYTDATVKVEGSGNCGALAGYTYGTIKNCYAHNVLAGNAYYGSFENCYYIGEDDETDGTVAVTLGQLTSGEIAYLLQSGILGEEYFDEDLQEWVTGEPEQVWGQDLSDENSHPVFGGKKVCFENGVYCNEVTDFEIIDYNADTKTASVSAAEAGTYTVIFADYEGERLVNVECTTVTFTEETVQTALITKGFSLDKNDKIMLWNMIRFVPKCDSYIVE